MIRPPIPGCRRRRADARLDGNTTIGDEASDQITILGTLVGEVVARVEGRNVSDNDLTIGAAAFSRPRRIDLPDEDGAFMTTTSAVSTLQEVGDVRVGNLVAGFGAAEVASLAVTGSARLNGETIIGDGYEDRILFEGSIASHTIRFDRDGLQRRLRRLRPRVRNYFYLTIAFCIRSVYVSFCFRTFCFFFFNTSKTTTFSVGG